MRMRQVEAFRAVMLSGGVTAASAMLNISQPSVSRLIADLEHAVGFVRELPAEIVAGGGGDLLCHESLPVA